LVPSYSDDVADEDDEDEDDAIDSELMTSRYNQEQEPVSGGSAPPFLLLEAGSVC
jgi:hypothetical protein